VNTEPALKASVAVIANGKKVGEGNLEKTVADTVRPANNRLQRTAHSRRR
jgi:hypothetical protein